MTTGAEVQKERILYAVLGVFMLGVCIYFYEEVFATGTPAPTPQQAAVSAPVVQPEGNPVAIGPEAKTVGTTSAALDPTLHMDAMLVSEAVEYSGSGRNIFSQNSAPPIAIPVPVAKARPQPQVAAYVPPPIPQGPPPPPPIDLKFFGTAQMNGKLVAMLLHGDSVLTASPGDVVARRYKIISVEAKTIQVEDMQNNNRQTLPLLVN